MLNPKSQPIRWAIRWNRTIVVRAIPTREAAQRLLGEYPGGKLIVDPRSVQR